MFIINVPKTLWFDAIQTVTYLMNMMSTRILSYKLLLEVLFPDTPLFSLPPKMFGCICYVHVPKFDCIKLDLKDVEIRKGINVSTRLPIVSLYLGCDTF